MKSEMQTGGNQDIQDTGHRPLGPTFGGIRKNESHGGGLEREKRPGVLGWDCLGMEVAEEGSRNPGARREAPSQRTKMSKQMDLRKECGCGEQRSSPHTLRVAEGAQKGMEQSGRKKERPD